MNTLQNKLPTVNIELAVITEFVRLSESRDGFVKELQHKQELIELVNIFYRES